MVDSDREAKRTKINDARDECSNNGGLGFSLNGYKGFKLGDTSSSSTSSSIPTVSLNDLTPEKFFQDFISQRKPCVIEGCQSLKDVFTYESLATCAGNDTIQVEKRKGLEESFGQLRTSERQINMTIQKFLDTLLDEKQGEYLYLTTQSYEDKDGDNNEESSMCYYPDHPFGAPCRQLLNAGKIPFQPDIAGNLVLQSCNLVRTFGTHYYLMANDSYAPFCFIFIVDGSFETWVVIRSSP